MKKLKNFLTIELAIKVIIGLMILVGVLFAIYMAKNDVIKESDFAKSFKEAITIEPKDKDEATGFELDAQVSEETAEYYEELKTRETPSFKVHVGEDIPAGIYELDSQIVEPGCQVKSVVRYQGEQYDNINVLDHNNPTISYDLGDGDIFQASYYCKNEEGIFKFVPEKTMKIIFKEKE
jgi:hypothetical protein